MSNLDDTLRRIVQEESTRRNPELAAQHFSLGEEALRAQRYEEAKGHFQIALNWDANDKYFFCLGESYLGLDKLDDAVEAFNESVRLNPKKAKACSDAYYNSGRTHLESGRLNKSITLFNKAIRLNQENSNAHYGLGEAFEKKEDFESAARAFSKVIELEPKNAQAHFKLGGALYETGDISKAVVHYREAIRLGLDNADAHYRLGLALEKKKDYDEAIIHYRRAIALEPDHIPAHYELGNQLSKKRDYKNALEEYKTAQKLSPKSYEGVHIKLNEFLLSNGLDITMVTIPFGSFMMGAYPKESYWDKSWNYRSYHEYRYLHRVDLDMFFMSDTPITQQQYKIITGINPAPDHSRGDKLPAVNVSWYDAAIFCNKLSEIMGLDACYNEDTWECDFTKKGFRLPTEAEWEYACRAGTTTEYCSGNTKDDAKKVAIDTLGIYPVGQKQPNNWGIYDMHGPPGEWCNDFYDCFYYKKSPQKNPKGPRKGTEKVRRGGGRWDWNYVSSSSHRHRLYPWDKAGILGFRIVLSW